MSVTEDHIDSILSNRLPPFVIQSSVLVLTIVGLYCDFKHILVAFAVCYYLVNPEMIFPTVEAHTLHFEKRLHSIQEKLADFDVIFQAFPIVCSKLGMSILDFNAIMQSFSQEPQNPDQVFHRLLQNMLVFLTLI
jgi:hypothetical protein